jgi:hypothetical protein
MYRCSRELICDIRSKPKPKSSPQKVITIRGPNLSVRPPMAMVRSPLVMEASEMALDVIALVHPNSLSTGLKKTPNA